MDKLNLPLLIKKGAEADLYFTRWHGREAVMKQRVPKKYRPIELDRQIRTYRTIHEPQLMNRAKEAGVPTPTIFLVDIKNTTIVMQFIEGKQVKLLLNEVSERERQSICLQIGELIGSLHGKDIIHGDLTTSNMIMNSYGRIFLVDFGLGEKNLELEAKGVDLHLMKRALQSTHYEFAADCYQSVIKGYSNIVGSRETQNILNKITEIERRGRYVAERKQEVSD